MYLHVARELCKIYEVEARFYFFLGYQIGLLPHYKTNLISMKFTSTKQFSLERLCYVKYLCDLYIYMYMKTWIFTCILYSHVLLDTSHFFRHVHKCLQVSTDLLLAQVPSCYLLYIFFLLFLFALMFSLCSALLLWHSCCMSFDHTCTPINIIYIFKIKKSQHI